MPDIAIPKHIQEKIHPIVQGLERGIKAHFRKQSRGRFEHQHTQQQQKQAFHILRHMNYCLQHLCRQHESLQMGVKVLEQELWPQVLKVLKRLSSSTCSSLTDIQTITALLSHVFQQVLRLHDGLILCISGECRHAGDHSHPKYPSQLQHQADTALLQPDGYTQLYSADRRYNATSWDEFHNPTCGLITRLHQALHSIIHRSSSQQQQQQQQQRDEWWDTLVETYAPTLESVLWPTLESQQTAAQQAFVTITKTMEQDLLRTLPNCRKVQWKLADKMESWYVQWGVSSCQLGRLASHFQVVDPQGVLPASNRWKSIQQLPSFETANTQTGGGGKQHPKQHKKKRRRIVDSDDDDDKDEEEEKASPSKLPSSNGNSGIQVQIRQIQTTKPSGEESYQASIRTIKENHGVDAEALAASREILEAETNQQQAEEQDDAATSLEEKVRQVQRLRSVWKRTLRRSNATVEELWSARECLRQATLEAGKHLLLEPPEGNSNKNSSAASATAALPYLKQARQLIQAQQETLPLIGEELTETERAVYRRNLSWMHQQVTIYIGVAYAQQEKWQQALLELEPAVVMQRMGPRQEQKMNPHACDNDAERLESMARRWLGKSLWKQGRRQECAKYLQQTVVVGTSKQLHLLDAYHAGMILTEVATDSLEQYGVSQLRESAATKEGDGILEYAVQGLRQAATASKLLHGGDNNKNNELPEDVLIGSELRQTQQELEEWWKRKKQVAIQRITASGPQTDQLLLARSDVSRDESFSSAPTGRMMWKEHPCRASKRQRRIPGGAGYSNIGPSAPDPVQQPKQQQQGKYRPWGDELLPQTVDKKTGKSIPNLVYPCIAPDMPPEFVALSAQWQSEVTTPAAGTSNTTSATR